MPPATEATEAIADYAAAHRAHYATKDLLQAIELYRDIITAHPASKEADYSLAQIQNIVNTVVPKEALFEAQVDLVLTRLKPEPPDVTPAEVST